MGDFLSKVKGSKIIEEDGTEGIEYSSEDVYWLRLDFEEKCGCSPEMFLQRYNHPDHPSALGLSASETHGVCFRALFLEHAVSSKGK